MESLQTSCPNCGSSFKISQQQLNAAGGHVRCGSCRHVFDAQSRAVSTGVNPIATHGINPKTGRSTLEGEIGEFSQSFLDLNKTGQGTSPFLDMSDLDKTLAEKEEEWAQALLDEDDDSNKERPKIPDYLSLGDNSLKNKVNESLADGVKPFGTPEEVALAIDAPEGLDKRGSSNELDDILPNDIDGEKTGTKSQSNNKSNVSDTPRPIHSLDHFLEMSESDSDRQINSNKQTNQDSFNALDDFDILDEGDASRKVDEYSDTFEDKLDALFGDDTEEKPAAKIDDPFADSNDPFADSSDPFEGLDEQTLNQPASKADLIQQIEADPLELTLPSKRWQKLKTFGWVMLALVLLCLPLAQYIHFNFNDLAQQPNLRPLFGQACEKLGCTLPAQTDISLIKTGNLVVRSHPEEAGALAIDAVITNRATYSQPFPVLELLFTDAQGSVVAARAFQPSEYLKGELTGVTLMKQRQPVHIGLSIKDPGAEAVGYALQLKPAP